MFLTPQASFGYHVTREQVDDLLKLMIDAEAEKQERARKREPRWTEKLLQIGIETFVYAKISAIYFPCWTSGDLLLGFIDSKPLPCV